MKGRWVRKSASEGTIQSKLVVEACLPAEVGGHRDEPNEAKRGPDCRAARREDRREGPADPEDHSAEADVTLHAANPLLCPAKDGGRHRGKEISEADGGAGFVPGFVPGFAPPENSNPTTLAKENVPATSRIDESTCTPKENVREHFREKARGHEALNADEDRSDA